MPKKATKKTVKKAVKKTAKKLPKRAIKKTKKDLVQAPPEHCFWVSDGSVLSNLLELRDALNEMHDDIFYYHVSKERNDFADWIEHVLDDVELAGKVRKSKKPNTARNVIVTRLRVYSI